MTLFLEGGSTPSRAVVQSAGGAFRLKANFMKDEFDRGSSVMGLLLRYTQALITQWRKRRFAIGTIRLTNNCAAGCC